MARANATIAPLRAGAAQGIARSLTGPAYAKLLAAEPWLRRVVPALMILFIGVLASITYIHVTSSRDEALGDAVADTDVVASLFSSALGLLARDGQMSPALGQIAPAHALDEGRRVYLTDRSGTIIAAHPDTAPKTRLADLLGDKQPLTIFADRAGVLIIALPDATTAIATVRALPEPFGQVAVVQPVGRALEPWREKTKNYLLLIGAASIVLIGISVAYFSQAWRAHEADAICDKVASRLNTALSRGRCGLWDWDIARGTIYWSDSMYEILGFEKRSEYLSFGDVNQLVHPDDGDLYALADMLAGRETTTVDHAFRFRDSQGEWIWIRARAELVRDSANRDPHLIGIAVDVSEQRRLAEATAAADLRLRDAIETISEAFVFWDCDNRLVMCNSKFQNLHNLHAAMVQPGTAYTELADALTPCIVENRGGDTDRGARSYEAQLPDNRWLQINERRTKDGGYVSVGTDITQLKRQEERLLDSERKLTATVSDLKRSRQTLETQAQLLVDLAERYREQKAEAEMQRAEAESANRAKTEFLAKMSHELRTPLNAILGFSEIMEQGIFGPLGSEKYEDYCKGIRRSGGFLLSLIADILDMSELDAGRIQIERHPVDISRLTQEVAATLRPAAEIKNIALDIDTRAAIVPADPRALRKILLQLMNNAIKYTPAGGHVGVTLRAIGGGVNIYVKDTGIGIPRHALAKLGRPFEWVDMNALRPTEGTGLGLAIARSFTQLHGGSLRIRSAEGTGTIVMVRIPGHTAQVAQVAHTAHATHAA